jgi:hypothetical protein
MNLIANIFVFFVSVIGAVWVWETSDEARKSMLFHYCTVVSLLFFFYQTYQKEKLVARLKNIKLRIAFAPYVVYLFVYFAFILFWFNTNNLVKHWLFYSFCFIFIVFSNYLTYTRSELENQLEKKE